MEGTLEGAHRIYFFAGDCDDSTAPWHLENVVAMMCHSHEPCRSQIPKDGVVWEANVGDVEVDELSAVVVALADGDREADLPYRGGGAIGYS